MQCIGYLLRIWKKTRLPGGRQVLARQSSTCNQALASCFSFIASDAEYQMMHAAFCRPPAQIMQWCPGLGFHPAKPTHAEDSYVPCFSPTVLHYWVIDRPTQKKQFLWFCRLVARALSICMLPQNVRLQILLLSRTNSTSRAWLGTA